MRNLLQEGISLLTCAHGPPMSTAAPPAQGQPSWVGGGRMGAREGAKDKSGVSKGGLQREKSVEVFWFGSRTSHTISDELHPRAKLEGRRGDQVPRGLRTVLHAQPFLGSSLGLGHLTGSVLVMMTISLLGA